MNIKQLAKNLANRVNQEHYIEHELKKVYLQGYKDSKAKEMLTLLNRVRLGEFPEEEIKELIEQATKID